MKKSLEIYKNKIFEILKKIFNILKDKKREIIMFFVFPLFISLATKVIFEEGYSDFFLYVDIIKESSFKTLFEDIRYLCIVFFSIENILEYIIILGLELILWGITGKLKRAITILTIISLIEVTINIQVFSLRGTALTITDFLAVNTAFNVLSRYKIIFSKVYIITIIISFILLILFLKFMKKENKIGKIYIKILYVLIGIFLILVVTQNRYFKNIDLWNLSTTYINNGQFVTMLRTFDDLFVAEPEEYDKESAEQTLQEYKKEEEIGKELPNIIVIMNESFSDINKEYDLNLSDNISFYHSLEENTVKGNAYVSVLGGETSITEWEFLTGNSAAFIPKGSIPYIQYINDNKENLATILNDLNYHTLAFHSYDKSGYNRKKVYEKFSFKKSYFSENMNDEESDFTGYPTDESTYENYFNFTKNINENKFGFIVTMQNHSPYSYDKTGNNYTSDEEINDYLNLTSESDKALKELVERLKKEEKTIILFFGDHQPSFISEDIDLFKEEEWMENYKVPFAIWANYDIEEKKDIEISANYLSVLLSDVAGIQKSEYMNFLTEIRKEIPIITANGYKAENGEIYKINDESSPYYELIKKYNILQYYQMFDKEI